MSLYSEAAASDPSDEIASLVRTLHDTQERLHQLTGGQVDAVLHESGQSFLLQQAQGKLRESESDQRRLASTMGAILNALPAHICLLDQDGLILSCNEAWRLLPSIEVGEKGDTGPGQNYLEVCDAAQGPGADDARATADGTRAVLAGVTPEFSLEYPCHIPNKKRWFQVVVSPVGNERPGGAVVMHIDITERKLAEQALKTTASNLETSQAIAHLGSWEIDLIEGQDFRSGIYSASDETYRILGYEPRSVQVSAEFFFSNIPTDFHAFVTEELSSLVQDRQQHTIVHPIIRPSGEKRIVRSVAQVMTEERNDGSVKVFGTTQDITESKVAEERILAESALLEAQLNSTLDGILIVDLDGKMILQNQRMVDLWKIPLEIATETDDRRRREWVAGQVKDKAAFIGKIEKLYEHPDEISRDELELVNGGFVDRYSSPVVGKDGRHYGRIWVFRDITDRKLAEGRSEEQIKLMNMAGAVGKLGAWSLSLPDQNLVWSEEVYRLHEVESNFKPNLHFALSFYPPFTRRKIEAALESGQAFDLESEFVTAKGRKAWIRTTSAVEMKDGKVSRFYGIFQDVTDQKRTEMRFRRLVDSNAQGVMLWNRAGEITECNDAFLQLVGYTREDLKSGQVNWQVMTPLELVHLDLKALNEIDAHGACVPYEKEYVRKDGSRVPILLGAATFEDDPNEGISFALDLTDRKQAEQAQRLSEERFSNAFEYAPNGMILVSVDGDVITANRTMCELIGYSLAELSHGVFEKITHPDDYAREQEFVRMLEQNEVQHYQMEKRYFHRQGHEVWVHLSSSLVRDADGQPSYFIQQAQDITKIKGAYQQIEEQAALIDEASDAIFSRDLDHRILFWSKGAERLYGWTSEEATGKTVTELLKADAVKFAEADRNVRKDGQWNGEIQKESKAGTSLFINSRWTLVSGSNGQPRSILTIDSDVTERKRLEQQFLRAQRMEGIGTLAGGIAHDLNNILAPIMMSIDILKSLTPGQEAAEILETIRISAKRGADIVRQVLSFARGVESKRIEVQPKHILEDVENIVRNTFPKSVQVRTTIQRDTYTILGDPTQIHQILLNLCVNARDAMPNGGKLNLTVENFVLDDQYSVMSDQAKPGPYVQISVTDTGSGIPPDLVEKIFEPFFTTKEVGKGTGLGLSTVMAIVKSHEGLINVYSEMGKGTTFKVYLPAVEISPEKRQAQTQRVSLPRGNGETVLVVDDEASILTITSQTLVAFGYRVLKAADGAEAVAIYADRRNEINVVLTDMMMPVLDGSALIHALKRINPSVKIIAASGLNADGGLSKVSETGANHFLTKPYTAGTLLKTLREILGEP